MTMYDRQVAQAYLAGEIACTLSHLKAIRTAYMKGYNMALVLEDDVSLKYVERWKVSLSKLLGAVSFFSGLARLQEMLEKYPQATCIGPAAIALLRM